MTSNAHKRTAINFHKLSTPIEPAPGTRREHEQSPRSPHCHPCSHDPHPRLTGTPRPLLRAPSSAVSSRRRWLCGSGSQTISARLSLRSCSITGKKAKLYVLSLPASLFLPALEVHSPRQVFSPPYAGHFVRNNLDSRAPAS